MEILVKPREKLKVKIDGEAYDINKPLVKDQMKLELALKESEKTSNYKPLIEWCVSLGFKEEIILNLENDQLMDLVSKLVNPSAQLKKS